ncbi:DUF1566 domain-containing protein [Methanolobus sediminis]|uniref:DUF1566 domain-containing protein n=1 Tax=Methanolobus sediminis TaxID=3072978 RepID=A0AA51YJQ5_9EURY|nr:DUF1566 domain-containing protein [Methanolobus sediminis]WMW25841.1 DUF1566 domain-containing protein [Methanolobus sediminis]
MLIRKKVILSICIILIVILVAGCAGPRDRQAPTEDVDGTSEISAEDTANDVSEAEVTEPGQYVVTDTMQYLYYGNQRVIHPPSEGDAFYGQDAQYNGIEPHFVDNGDGTITDESTGLMWQKEMTRSDFDDAENKAEAATTGGYDDWRVPTIKEMYSLMDFRGTDPDPMAESASGLTPFVDTEYFDFEYPTVGRIIDAQYITSTEYVYKVMTVQAAFFGLNLADGRIKGYPQSGGDLKVEEGRYYLRLVRGNTAYGTNFFVDNGDGTITDEATGLTWTQSDSGDDEFADMLSAYTNDDGSLNWEEALDFAENLDYAGYDDWRLPNAKELQSIVDYSRSPDTTDSPAIDPIFECTQIVNEMGNDDYGFYWTGTTHAKTGNSGSTAVYVSFGRALGYMNGKWMDVHGAGAQRSDPKSGDPDDYGNNAPQGDAIRVYNYVRPVRG